MGISEKSALTRGEAGFRPNRRGLALVSAMLAMVAVSVLVAGLFVVADLNTKAVKNREEAARAVHLAEAGSAHALGVMRSKFLAVPATYLIRGFDSTANTANDGLLAGWTALTSDEEIPAAGKTVSGGTYFVTILDDPADGDGDPKTDSNHRLLLNCRGVTTGGATAEVNLIVNHIVLPGISVGGNLEISGKPKIQGDCGGMHANGNITGGGQPTVTTQASATGTVSVSVSPKLNNQPPVVIPTLNPLDFCDGPNTVHITNNLWKPGSAQLVAGTTYCVTGNVEFQGDFGSLANMRSVSVIATGSIKVPSKPFIKAAHPDGIVLLAGGDMDIQGDAGMEGLVYGGGQCYISAKPNITGQLVCANNSPHPGENWVPANLISGDATITYGCGDMLGNAYRVTAWYPTIGS